jgi:hypothetical protein
MLKGKEPNYSVRTLPPVTIYLPQIPYGLSWNRNQAFLVRRQRSASLATERTSRKYHQLKTTAEITSVNV